MFILSSVGVCVINSVALVTLAEIRRLRDNSFVLKTGILERIEHDAVRQCLVTHIVLHNAL